MAQVLVFMAFFVQTLIPAGFMPNLNAAQAATSFVICSGMEQKTIYLDQDGKPTKQTPGQQHEKPCVFSGVAPVGDAPALHLIQLPVTTFTTRTILLPVQVTLSSPALSRPPAIGPPSLL